MDYPPTLIRQIQFVHPEKLLAQLPAPEALDAAALFGLEPVAYAAIRAELRAQAQRQAQTLAAQPEIRALVAQLPFQPGARVVGLGDSITDDDHSWLEQLRWLLAEIRPADRIAVINAGISGNTTNQLLERFADVAALRPDWIICLAGTNDARRHGPPPWDITVSAAETARNLTALCGRGTLTGARWVWITPPPVLDAQIAAHFAADGQQLGWQSADIAATAAFLRNRPEPVIDVWPLFGAPPQADWLLDDGLHPSLAGQSAILTALLTGLASKHVTTKK